ncbi:outer membrane receptor protein involved in Fe transport [Prosthecobacter fusiformis]|uniref:Outer membrane receptor protein involved in Fe transport n=1 Tax=Prosthecobacter fusiformis TaxID=48464 RepID=A0A4R7RRH1_9BACT|nr:TonB-dependent receptor plug domain-containing protein [Prosthecobacter fusiformis]TDU68120.1 outer membrane receptor protein involved in Fe transport [Prosthecobacter fusiformis]
MHLSRFISSSLLALALAGSIAAQEASPTDIPTLPEVVVEGKASNLLGTTDGASKGRATQEDFLSRPLMRRGEILETIPGVIITQHAGGGKANQYFLRGFNLDHGTDFSISLDGMPLNMRTHAHGQGYTDLNPLIPELVQAIDYAKGTYTAADGDLSTAGSANFLLWDMMPQNMVRLEFGEHNYYRALIAGTMPIQAGENEGIQQGLTYGLEQNYYDGPWAQAEEFNRWNGLLRYFRGDEDNKFSITFMGYRGTWTSTDQIPLRAVNNGTLDRFSTLDPTAGGESQRYSLNVALEHRDDDVVTRANIYGIYYSLDLFSNFTYFTKGPQGDQFEQSEQRWVFGGQLSRTWEDRDIFGIESDLTVGFQTRHDLISDIGLYDTSERKRLATTRQDDIWEGSAGIYGEMVNRWTPWFRTVLGLRGDLYYFESLQSTVAGEDAEWAGIVSPKFSAVFGPWHETELYLNFGTGFHSNDARGVTARSNPADALVRTMGAEIGLRTQAIPDLTTTVALFWLQSDSELLYVGDAGTNEPGPGSERYGVELATYWRPNNWFSADAELALTYARLKDSGNADRIPNSVPVMFSGGINLGAQGNADGWFAGMRVRAFTGRPLEETGQVEGRESIMVNGTVGYRRKNWEAAVDCLNLLNRSDNDIEYYYESQLQNELVAVNDTHFHPVEPRMFRFRVTYRF